VPDAVIAVICAPDDGWSYHPKYIGSLQKYNKIYVVASCWTFIDVVTAVNKKIMSS
jgi:hypothetical protein